jgi:hypothetical protein
MTSNRGQWIRDKRKEKGRGLGVGYSDVREGAKRLLPVGHLAAMEEDTYGFSFNTYNRHRGFT